MQPSAEIRSRVTNLYERWSAGDGGFLDDLLTTGDTITVVGTDPDEWWQGRRHVFDVWSTQINEMGGIEITPGRLEAYEAGDLGWSVDSPSLTMPDGTKASIRLTCVFARESDGWRLVHGHASVGVPNEEAIGQELTT
jgi:ketosteroid isomerase-like protein